MSIGIVTIMATHNMEYAIALGNRLIMMNKGEIVHQFADEENGAVGVSDLGDLFRKCQVCDAELLLERN